MVKAGVVGWKAGSRLPPGKAEMAAIFNAQWFDMRKKLKHEPEAKDVVNANRSKDAPLHDYFEWDDAVGAEKYRIEQAQYLIRCLVWKEDAKGEPLPYEPRVLVSLKDETAPARAARYVPLLDILSDKDLRVQMLQQAATELDVFRRKFNSLKELVGWFEAGDKLLKKEIAKAMVKKKPAKAKRRK